ncbi:MAG TPA: hypothetical protein VFD39_01740, partial [Trueperaceae bacterium]|nr:hypothetical protein [Trueperaceae bacterium]
MTYDELVEKIDDDYRIIDLEIDEPALATYTAALVSNTGVHQKDWWWYLGVSDETLQEKIDLHKARILDLETFVLDGEQLFAAILVPNDGAAALDWSWYFNADADFLENAITEYDQRIVDLEHYLLDGTWYFSAVMIVNSGADNKDWWWYTAVSADFLTDRLTEHGARLVDLEKIGPDSYTAVLEKNPGKGWWWWLDGSMDSINLLANKEGARVIDIERHSDDTGPP